MAFRKQYMLCGDIRTEIIEQVVCLLVSGLNHQSAKNNGENRSVVTVNREIDLYRAGATR